jgi:hypothetical protein
MTNLIINNNGEKIINKIKIKIYENKIMREIKK